MTGHTPAPIETCDVIMKGGITSGVVYPKAILRLAARYRFRNVGGTSAGAIAATITAAAEYGRNAGGFDRLAAIPDTLQAHLLDLFQPDPRAQGLYDLIMAAAIRRWPLTALGLLLRAGLPWNLAGLMIGLGGAALAGGIGGWIVGIVAALLLVVLISAGTALWRLYAILPALDYGLCAGSAPDGATPAFPPLSDWLADTLDAAAGLEPALGRPLIFQDLWTGGPGGIAGTPDNPSIRLRTVTTNLTMSRPHTLPDLGDRNFYFDPAEMRRVFPARVVDWMVTAGTRALEAARARDGDRFIWPEFDGRKLCAFPEPGDLPVVVAARMSLSFPFLIAAVPLYRIDWPTRQADGKAVMRRILFSDGGISSNFPIHFFDALLPTRPTFGISLDQYSADRPDRRVHLPMKAIQGQWIGLRGISGIGGFVMSLFNAASEWQDELRTVLPGYRERVAHIYLKPDEGGLNLAMPPETIRTLTGLGDRAGLLMTASAPADGPDTANFDFDDHRWRRFLSLYAAFEAALEAAGPTWGDAGDPDSYAGFIARVMDDPKSYARSNPADRAEVFRRMNLLMTMAQTEWQGRLRDNPGLVPKPPTKLRITPEY
ncbi:patatin-like phospholipase family protein [Tistrella bauzanensis]|nr:patatin-like phospholipase family protein [Tistrella bauzanensis]